MDLNDNYAVRDMLFRVLIKLYEKDELMSNLYEEKWTLEHEIEKLKHEIEKLKKEAANDK